MKEQHRILVMSHGHPDLIPGGAEIAAHKLFQTYKARPDVSGCWFLAAADQGRGAMGRIQMHRKDEFLWEQGLADFFRMEAANKHEVTGYFAELIAQLDPTIVHTHHYFKFGLEYLKVLKGIKPSIRTVLTLHEYIAICPNAGLMMSKDSDFLCQSGDHASHKNCAPNRTADDLWLRFNRFQSYFRYVDHFIAPSEFLRQRYIEWGIAPDRITYVPNGQPDQTALPARPLAKGEGRNRFAFFGQLGQHKGLDILLEAMTYLGTRRKSLTLEIHGANLEYQPKAFQKRIKKLLKPLLSDQSVRWMGKYTSDDLENRMRDIDWVCVPSIWYENAPLVIQEAFGHGRPVISSDLGGMKEMVTNGVDGICLPRGNVATWGAKMLELSGDPSIWKRLNAGIKPPPPLKETADRALTLALAKQEVLT